MCSRARRGRGFALIDLLAAVVIMALLVVILLSLIAGICRQAKAEDAEKLAGQSEREFLIEARLATVEELFEAMSDFSVLPEGVETSADLRQRLEEARQLLSKPAEHYVPGMWEGLWRGVTGGRRGVALGHERERGEAQRLLSLLEQMPSGAAPAEKTLTGADDRGAE